MNNFFKRSLSGIAYVLIIIASVIIHPYIFLGAFAILQFFLLKEFKKLALLTGFSINLLLNFMMGLLFSAMAFSVSIGWVSSNLFIIVLPLCLLVFSLEIFRKNANPFGNAAASAFGFLYISVPFGLINLLIFPGFPNNNTFNPLILIVILIVLWMYDTGAYLFGSLFGKHKLLKRISPNKSWEGLIGGAIVSIITSVLAAVILQSPDLKTWIGIALLVVLFGTLGDLFESMLKRNAGVKDSGNILPGHGGLLDRFDSMLFIVPPVVVWLMLAGKL